MFENPRRGRTARNFTTNVPKILDLKSSSEQIFSEIWRWVPLHKDYLSTIQLDLTLKFFSRAARVISTRRFKSWFLFNSSVVSPWIKTIVWVKSPKVAKTEKVPCFFLYSARSISRTVWIGWREIMMNVWLRSYQKHMRKGFLSCRHVAAIVGEHCVRKGFRGLCVKWFTCCFTFGLAKCTMALQVMRRAS